MLGDFRCDRDRDAVLLRSAQEVARSNLPLRYRIKTLDGLLEAPTTAGLACDTNIARERNGRSTTTTMERPAWEARAARQRRVGKRKPKHSESLAASRRALQAPRLGEACWGLFGAGDERDEAEGKLGVRGWWLKSRPLKQSGEWVRWSVRAAA